VVRPSSAVAIAALVTGVLAACLKPSYQCRVDSDCDVGSFGRCEIDQRCTAVDPTCATNRRYSDHSGPASRACFDDSALPLNLCAAGQPPAVPVGCVADVCAAVRACCLSSWSEACVQQAQLRCSDLVCDTRIAITATTATTTELWDLRWTGTAWTARSDARTSVLAWLAPAPGQATPRLAGFTAGALDVEGVAIPVSPARTYFEATSVDFDRDGRPTATLSFTATTGTPRIGLQVVKLDDGTSRDIAVEAAARLSWGDLDHDGFPDALASVGAAGSYNLLFSIQPMERPGRDISGRDSTGVTGGGTGGVALRSFDWIDLDVSPDRQLEAVAFGYSVNFHQAPFGDQLGTTRSRFDCAPPTTGACGPAPGDAATQMFAGAALPSLTMRQRLVLASAPARGLYRAELPNTVVPYALPVSACGASCPPIIAVVVRDLDGDHQLDVIAIDGDLQVFTGLARDGLSLTAAYKLATAGGFTTVRTSVSGAPR
jgi:hypothetical protein